MERTGFRKNPGHGIAFPFRGVHGDNAANGAGTEDGALGALHHFHIVHRKEIGDPQQLVAGHVDITDAHAVNHGQGVGFLVHPADDGVAHGTALPGAAAVQREDAGSLGKGSCQGFNARFLEFFRIDDGNGYPGPVVRHARKVGRHGQFRHDLHGFRTGGGLGVFFFSGLGKRGLACECGKANGNSAHLKGFLRIKHGCGALRSVTRRTVGQPHRLVFWLARQARLQWRYRSGFTPVFPNLFPARLRASLRSVTLPIRVHETDEIPKRPV